jgi:hypothetical protein
MEMFSSLIKPSDQSGFVRTMMHIVPCYVCNQVNQSMWVEHAKKGFIVGFHCEKHTADFHAVAPVTWNCCDKQYHPSKSYEWRSEDQENDEKQED